jgi:hypothetical protein
MTMRYAGRPDTDSVADMRFARLAEAAALWRDAAWHSSRMELATDLALETFCCEVKHHG